MKVTVNDQKTGMSWDKIAVGEVVYAGSGAFYLKDRDNRAVCLTGAPGTIVCNPSMIKWVVVKDVELKVTL